MSRSTGRRPDENAPCRLDRKTLSNRPSVEPQNVSGQPAVSGGFQRNGVGVGVRAIRPGRSPPTRHRPTTAVELPRLDRAPGEGTGKERTLNQRI